MANNKGRSLCSVTYCMGIVKGGGFCNKHYKRSRRHILSEHEKRYERELRQKALALLGDKCAWCGFLEPAALQIDHKKGGGGIHRKKGRYNLYHDIIKNPKDYQRLCANCNCIKKAENNENKDKPRKKLFDD